MTTEVSPAAAGDGHRHVICYFAVILSVIIFHVEDLRQSRHSPGLGIDGTLTTTSRS